MAHYDCPMRLCSNAPEGCHLVQRGEKEGHIAGLCRIYEQLFSCFLRYNWHNSRCRSTGGPGRWLGSWKKLHASKAQRTPFVGCHTRRNRFIPSSAMSSCKWEHLGHKTICDTLIGLVLLLLGRWTRSSLTTSSSDCILFAMYVLR